MKKTKVSDKARLEILHGELKSYEQKLLEATEQSNFVQQEIEAIEKMSIDEFEKIYLKNPQNQ